MLVTVEQDVAIVVQAVQLGAVNYLIKPVSPAILVASVARALASRAAKTGGAAGVARPELVGMSRAMVNVRHLIDLASRTDVNVVVTGETGTGKELVARTVHRLSRLAQAPFVAHSCALSTPERFDLEFLGHSAGGLDPLTPERPGLLAQSDGGMLLLDEFECLAQAEQAKLVRILDDGEFRPVGAARSRAVSVRFLAATTRNPSSLLAQGTLRADLYYRLRGFEIHLPPLRERAEDIPQLAEFFLAKQGKRLTPQALHARSRHLRRILTSRRGITQVRFSESDLRFSNCGKPFADQSPDRHGRDSTNAAAARSAIRPVSMSRHGARALLRIRCPQDACPHPSPFDESSQLCQQPSVRNPTGPESSQRGRCPAVISTRTRAADQRARQSPGAPWTPPPPESQSRPWRRGLVGRRRCRALSDPARRAFLRFRPR